MPLGSKYNADGYISGIVDDFSDSDMPIFARKRRRKSSKANRISRRRKHSSKSKSATHRKSSRKARRKSSHSRRRTSHRRSGKSVRFYSKKLGKWITFKTKKK